MVVIYSRVSNKDNVSSIDNQIEICRSFATFNKLVIGNVYSDIGYSGSNFNRPSFKRLIEDIKKNKISTILIKDISRLGRSFLETSYYLEEFFVKYQVKVISINDDIEDEIILSIKNFLNQLYVKECSRKRNKYIETHKDKILFSNILMYGYILVNKKIEIVPNEAEAVRLIFESYLKDYSIKDIIVILKNNKYLVPGYSKKGYSILEGNRYDWKPYMLYRILNSKEYTGIGVNLKTKKVQYKKIKNNNRVELLNKYPSIVSLDDFMKVNNKLSMYSKNKKVLSKKDNEIENIVYGVLLGDFSKCFCCFKEKLINEYRRRKMQKNGYFKEINIIVKNIKEVLENNKDSFLISKYNDRINKINNEIDIDVEEFIKYFSSLKIDLIKYLINNIEITKEDELYKVKVFYLYSN